MKRKLYMVGIIAVIIAIISISVSFSFNDTVYEVTVTDKERITESHRRGDKTSVDSKYLIFADTNDGESLVFENTDKFIRGKFRSSNIQGQLKVGSKYKITVVGIRVPLFSWYQNILKVENME